MVGIVILNFNNSKATKDCLESIVRYESPHRYKICLVDNSTDAVDREKTMSIVDKIGKDNLSVAMHVILLDKNEGYAKGNNVGARYFEQDEEVTQILILNNDIVLTEPILDELSKYMHEHQECGVVSTLLYNKEGEIDKTCARRKKNLYSFLVRTPLVRKFKWVREKSKSEYILEERNIEDYHQPFDIDLPSGSCMMFEKKEFCRLGFFDPHTFLYFEEDILWSKLNRMGRKAVLLPYLSCIHLGASSINKQPSKKMERYYFSSMLYYLREYSGIRGAWPCIIRFMVKSYYKI